MPNCQPGALGPEEAFVAGKGKEVNVIEPGYRQVFVARRTGRHRRREGDVVLAGDLAGYSADGLEQQATLEDDEVTVMRRVLGRMAAPDVGGI